MTLTFEFDLHVDKVKKNQPNIKPNEPFRTLDQQPGTDFHMTFVLHDL